MTDREIEALLSIADTLDARADAGQPLGPREMTALAAALRDLTVPVDRLNQHIHFDQHALDAATLMRPTWRLA